MISDKQIEDLLRGSGYEKTKAELIRTHKPTDQTLAMKLTQLERLRDGRAALAGKEG